MWLTTGEYAALKGCAPRKARSTLKRAFEKPGAGLVVRRAANRFAPNGLGYEVCTDSLSPALQEQLKDRFAMAVPAPVVQHLNDHRAAERDWWLRILGPLLNLAQRSPELVAATDALAAQDNLTDWRGRPIELPVRTIQRRLQFYRDKGIAAFSPKPRADKGKRKVILSLAADAAIPVEILEPAVDELRGEIGGYWAKGATLKLIQGRANFRFRELIAAAGCDCAALPEKALSVPRAVIERESFRRAIHVLYQNRKLHEDTRYHTKRSRAHLQPMDWVVGDVHPLDIVILREDGSRAHARLIGWLDVRTNRLFVDLVLCEADTGIRNADLIQSFLRMVAAWGAPKTLYIDNGAEYNFADNLNEALLLVAELRGADGRRLRVVRALPYHAASKPIEGMFALLERMLQDSPGHVGGDRMNQKTHRVGRAPKAFPGTLAQLNAIVQARIIELHAYPMRGTLNGRSPDQAYRAATEGGWQPVALDSYQILTVFGRKVECTIQQGVVNHNGRWWCEELVDYNLQHKKIVALDIPYWPQQRMVLLHIKTGELVGIAEPDPTFAFDDTAGARHSKRIAALQRAAVHQLARDTPKIDTVAEGLRIAALMPPPPAVAPIATLSVSGEAAAIGRALAEPPAEREARKKAARTARSRKATAVYGALANPKLFAK